MKNKLLKLAIAMHLLIVPSFAMAATTFLDFNDFPVTAGNLPGDSSAWTYRSRTTPGGLGESQLDEAAGSGWRTINKSSDNYWYWFYQLVTTPRCGWSVDTFGFLDIASKGHTGNALRHFVTGGSPQSYTAPETNCPKWGTQLYAKEQYVGPEQHDKSKMAVGKSYMYYTKTDNLIGNGTAKQPFVEAANANRLSMYVRLPDGWNNGFGGYGKPPVQTFQGGLFIDPINFSSHQYYNFLTQGGGWTKIQIEETSNGDNAGNQKTRYIPNMLGTLFKFYFTTLPYAGNMMVPFEVLYDDIVFDRDDYAAQNNETISNIAILYKDAGKTWEISFNDKYKNDPNANATYELRYSMDPITNENWSSATPVNIIAEQKFYIQARSDGKFQKPTPYYQGVWAPFKLSDSDTQNLSQGQTFYFAVKDISQIGIDSTVPANGINGLYGITRKGGRTYDTTPEKFEYAKDQAALPLIKRASYTLGDNLSKELDVSSPTVPINLIVQ